MKKIIAIGGGEIGRPGTKVETIAIDREIIKLSGKKNPKLLFIPTASLDSESYFEVIKKHFLHRLKCKVNVLYLIKEKKSKKEIRKKILNTDIIYVGGGNTSKMMKHWKKLGIDVFLKKAYRKGVVMSGVSAGANCWFKFGSSSSLKFKNKNTSLGIVRGLNLINILFCSHYDVEKKRKSSFKKILKKSKYIGIALENCVAIEMIDNKYRIIKSKINAKAYKIYWKNHEYFKEEISSSTKYLPLSDLLKK